MVEAKEREPERKRGVCKERKEKKRERERERETERDEEGKRPGTYRKRLKLCL